MTHRWQQHLFLVRFSPWFVDYVVHVVRTGSYHDWLLRRLKEIESD